MTGGGGGGGGQQQQGTGSQGAGAVPAQGGNAPVPQEQPVVNPQTQGEQPQEGQQEQGGDTLTVPAAFDGKSEAKVVNKPTIETKNEVQFTGVKEAIHYAGLVYYEEIGVQDLVTFTAVKKLDALLEFIKKEHPHAKRRPHFYFCIASPDGFIELKFGTQQKKSCKGWTIEPHIEPCRLHQRDIYNFGDKDYPLPPSCLTSVYSSPDAVPTLHYSVPVEGVTDPVTINIQISQRTAHHTAVAASAGSGSIEATPVPTKRGGEGEFDIENAKQKIKKVLIENHSNFAELLQFSLVHVANKLFEVHMIPPEVQQSPTYYAISTCFVSVMSLLDSKSALEKHCVKYLEALSSVGGPIEFAANLLREKWTAALEGALQFKHESS